MLSLACCLLQAAAAPAWSPADALAELVDLPTAELRARRATELAARTDTTLEQWRTAARAFGEFLAAEPGEHHHRVDLHVGDAVEATDVFVYVPPSYSPEKPAPLLLMAHGTGGTGQGLARMWRGPADALGMLVLAPSEAGANEGYAFSARERQAALAAIRWARRRFHVDENRIFAAGISRGGHLAWDLALRFPDLLAGIAPMIGGPRLNVAQGQNNLRYLENVRELPIRDLQGSKDDPRLVFNVRLAFEKLAALGATDAELHEFPHLGHSFDLSAVDWREFFAQARRRPVPLAVVRAFACPKEGRAFWVDALAAKAPVGEAVELKVQEDEWKRLQADDQAMRRFLDREAASRTARLQVERAGNNRFVGVGDRVTKFRLLLTAEMFDPAKPVVVELDGKTTSHRVKPSAAVLLREFAERFDRTFLPVAEVVVGK